VTPIVDRRSPSPPYRQIVADLRERISAAEFAAGARVPSTREITREWGVAMATATKALTELRQEGLIRSVPGVGTVVEVSPEEPSPRTRTRQGGGRGSDLNLDSIVETAIAICDAEGFAALSMRQLSTELGVAVMSLYHYVPGRDDLVDLMMDHVLGEVELPESLAGWRSGLELIARQQWKVCTRHPWIAQALSFSQPDPTPNSLKQTEWALQSLADLDLDPATKLCVAITVFSYVRGCAANLTVDNPSPESGTTWRQTNLSQEETILATMESGRYPHFAEIQEDLKFALDVQQLFEFGLQRMLDGLGVFLAARMKAIPRD
jgi:DNA-binding transcriptional regulator YhcF (GntR family)